MRTIKLVLEYDGTDLCGWQRQDNGPTVQGHLEDALAEMIGPTPVIGASRTDAGVHARGQVASFHTVATVPLHGFRLGLNRYLPNSIAVVDAAEVDDAFHARFSASGKHYRYSVLARPEPSPLRARTSWHRPRAICAERMRAAAATLVGTHDFGAFQAAGCSAKTTLRTLTRVEIVETDGDQIDLEVEGNAFLRNMVRILAGTLVEVGEGRRAPESLAAALASGVRTDAGQTAPARGLTLMEVFLGRSRFVKP
jgi:tRNA pseudouridine38-40 synthase